MSRTLRILDRLTILLLIVHFVAAGFYWPFVEQAFRRSNNVLGRMDLIVPTNRLFLNPTFNLGIYFLARFWAFVAPKIFTLKPETESRLRHSLFAVRVLATVVLFALTMQVVAQYVPDYVEKIPSFW
jgi:hypothetical protein